MHARTYRSRRIVSICQELDVLIGSEPIHLVKSGHVCHKGLNEQSAVNNESLQLGRNMQRSFSESHPVKDIGTISII
jgi:hypothetical protein